MLTCVCRPVSGNLPKMPPASLMPAHRASSSSSSSSTASLAFVSPTRGVVVTSEPKLNVSIPVSKAASYTSLEQIQSAAQQKAEISLSIT